MQYFIHPKGIEYGVIRKITQERVGEDPSISEENIAPDSRDWVDYLAWVDLGNEAEPFPEPEEQELSLEQKIQQKIDLMKTGEKVIAFIGVLNDTKAATLTPEQYVLMATDPNMAAAANMLKLGLLKTAKVFIATTSWSLYTTEEITSVLDFMTGLGIVLDP